MANLFITANGYGFAERVERSEVGTPRTSVVRDCRRADAERSERLGRKAPSERKRRAHSFGHGLGLWAM